MLDSSGSTSYNEYDEVFSPSVDQKCLHVFYHVLMRLQSVLPWAECPVNSNRTGYLEECEVASPTQYFFYRETLNISSSIDENGGIHMGQALCLLLAWIIVYLFIVRGVKSTGVVRLPVWYWWPTQYQNWLLYKS